MKRELTVMVVLTFAACAFAGESGMTRKGMLLENDERNFPREFLMLDNGGRELPVCLPGDPCGPGAMTQLKQDEGRDIGMRLRNSAALDNGDRQLPVCLPGDPCGPGAVR